MRKPLAYVVAAALLYTSLLPGIVSAAPITKTEKCPGSSVLLFPTWYQGLRCEVTRDGKEITKQIVRIDNINQVWVIVMNIVQWLIIAGGYVALYFILWSGFKFITANGDPSKITAAKNTILNAVIGLVIVLASVAIVRTIQAGVGGVVT